jgi:hypothetical protein
VPSWRYDQPLYLGQKIDTSAKTSQSVYAPNYSDGTLRSSGHYGWQDLGKRPGDIGGTFEVFKFQTDHSLSDEVHITEGSHQLQYVGRFAARQPALFSFNYGGLSLDAWGPTAYARMKPTKPSMDLAVSIGELKDFPGMLKQLASKEIFQLPKAFLAYQFGWRPMIKEIQDLVSMTEKINRRAQWLIRNNGKPVRTRCKLAETNNNPTVEDTFGYDAFSHSVVTQMYHTVPRSRIVRVENSAVWASARWRYWLPPGLSNVEFSTALKRELYGLSPRPSVIYNLMPWTWLIDWFTNLGDMVENLDAGVADRVAADYIYVMGSSVRKTTRESSASFFGYPDHRIVKVNAKVTYEQSNKKRIRGSPFGFGIKDSELSNMQLAILGALGLSRL